MTDAAVDWIAHHARTIPGKLATIDLASGRRHDYACMNDRVGRIAGFLRSAGVGRRDRVGLVALNSSDMLDIVFATWRIGAVHLALNCRLTAAELDFITADTAPRLVFVDQTFADLAHALQPHNPDVRWVSLDGLGGDTEFERAIETTGLACCLLREDVPDRIGAAGKAAMFTEIRIMKNDTEEAAPGEPGEIWMRGANVTREYWRRPEANEKAFVDGWLRSGDIGFSDEEGYITISDRIKDMYISGGENAYPAEVESLLYMLPQVSEVAVIGLPDEKWGEVGCAVIVLKKDQSLNYDTVKAHCRAHLASYKHPLRIEFRQEVPRNATGKVLKFVLRDELS